MFVKKGSAWEKKTTLNDSSLFETLLNKLKTYSKSFNSSSYSVTNTLADVYENIKFQHALWIELTDFAPETLALFGKVFEKGRLYNILKYTDSKTLSDSSEFRDYIKTGWIKAADSKLFEDAITPSRKEWFCTRSPKKVNQYINEPFDYMVIRYNILDPNSIDIDTRTAIVNSGYQGDYIEVSNSIADTKGALRIPSTPLDGNDVGWDRGEFISSTTGNVYITWGGDNQTNQGGESILVDLKKLSNDLNYLNDITIRLRSYFFDTLGNGKIELEVSTYKGGVMQQVGTDFINVGGFLVQTIKSPRVITTSLNGSNFNINGDEMGTIVFNVENSNAILTDLTSDYIFTNNLSFIDLLNTLDFSQFSWDMGTSGLTPDDVNYTDMILPYDFTEETLYASYQHSEEEWGYSERNLFTSDKVWKKLLNNYHVIDLATTENIILYDANQTPVAYPLILVDGIPVVNEHRILFKDQTDTKENGLYYYSNGVFKKDPSFSKDSDFHYFSCFIKEGAVNKDKEFFLDRKEDGKYPTLEQGECGCKCDCEDTDIICEHFTFVEGKNFVLRNRSSYRLLADHKFSDSAYFVQKKALTDFDYVDRYVNGTSSYYKVDDNHRKFEYFNDGVVQKFNYAGTKSTDLLNSRIEFNSGSMGLLRNQNELVIFNNFTTIPNTDVFTRLEFFGTNFYSDFDLYDFSGSTYKGIFLNNTNGSTQGFSLLDRYSFPNTLNIKETLVLTANATECSVLDDFVFYLAIDGVYAHYNGSNFLIKESNFPNKLRISKDSNIITLSWLEDYSPVMIEINETVFVNMLGWAKKEDYKIFDFSKKKIGDWEIKSGIDNNDLYLKNIQITNLDGTGFFVNVPKIKNSNNRYFDGLDDFIDFNLSYNKATNKTSFSLNPTTTTLKDSSVSDGSLTVEFKLIPGEQRINQTVFYMGNKSILYTTKRGGRRYTTALKPKDYINFVVNGGDGYPVFTINNNLKSIHVKANKYLTIDTETHVSFVWNYTQNKASGELYFDGELVGSYIDQRTSTNHPIDIRLFSFDKFYLGKSEINTSPYYKGATREFRLWNRAFNHSQIFARLNVSIDKDNENFISNLIGYWKMDDETSFLINMSQGNNFYKSTVDSFSLTGCGIFYGGLNNNLLLREIQSPQMIQSDANSLFVLDTKIYDNYHYSLNTSKDLGIFNNAGTTGVVFLPDPSTDSSEFSLYVDTISNKLVTDISILNKWGVEQQISGNDYVTIEIEAYRPAAPASSMGATLSVIYGTNSNISLNNISSVSGTSFDVWEKITLVHTQPSDDDIYLSIEFSVGDTANYFRNFSYKIERTNQINNIYKINYDRESVERIKSSESISSIYMEIDTSNLFTLETNDMYSFSSGGIVDSFTSGAVLDIAIHGTKKFFVTSHSLQPLQLWESNTLVLNTNPDDYDTSYVFEDFVTNKTAFYINRTTSKIETYSRDATTSGLFTFMSTYPFNDNQTLQTIDGILSISENDVRFNGTLIDVLNKHWNFNKKSILSIIKRDDHQAFILSKTIKDEIKIWLIDTRNLKITKISNFENETTLFISNGTNNLGYFINNGVEWLFINNGTSIYFYILEKGNKIDFKKLKQQLYIDTDKNIKNLYMDNDGYVNFSDTNIWIMLEKNGVNYVSNFTNVTDQYGLWNDILTYETTEYGILIGESGILFDDVSLSGTDFSVNYKNIIYKDDLNSIEAIKSLKTEYEGFKTKIWTGDVYTVGNTGRIIKTADNGTNWKVLNSGVYNDLKSVSFYDKNNGLIVGLNNTIIATFSAGDSFVSVQIPENIGIRDFYDVNYYQSDKALVVGSLGTAIHLTKRGFVWEVDKILNNSKLFELNVSIKDSDLDNNIFLTIIKDDDSDLYRQNIRKIEYLGNDEFLMVGDNNLLAHLRLSKQIRFVIPYLNFLQSSDSGDWVDVKAYDDMVTNEKRAFVVKEGSIYHFEWNRFNQLDEINIETVVNDVFLSNDNPIQTISIGINSLIFAGDRADIGKIGMFEDVYGTYGYSTYRQDLDLSSIFKPRMLFLDYYMGRKINMLLEDGSFIVPYGALDKSKLDCFYFKEGESIEFTDYGTVDNQNNYLAYQDHYFLNRRILDQPNSWGKTQLPYNRYNKKITAIDSYLENATWKGEMNTRTLNSDGYGYEFSNDTVTDLTYYQIGDLREDSLLTRMRLAWNTETSSYSTSGNSVHCYEQSSTIPLDENTNRYQFKTTTVLGVKKGDLIKLEVSDALFYVQREFNFSGNHIIEADGDVLDSLYTGSIYKVVINFMQTVQQGDVLNISASDKRGNVELVLGDKVRFDIKAEDLDLSVISTVEETINGLYKIKFVYDSFDLEFETEFQKGSTVDEVALLLRKSESQAIQLANALLEKRCLKTYDSGNKIIELDIFGFAPNHKTITDILVHPDNGKMYLTISDKKLFIIDIDDNAVDKIINLNIVPNKMEYDSFHKYVYISGGSSTNKTIDVFDTITEKVTNLASGEITKKPLFNPFNKHVFVPSTGNKIYVYNGFTFSSVITANVSDMVYSKKTNIIYTISKDNILKKYNAASDTLISTVTIDGGSIKLIKFSFDEDNDTLWIISENAVYAYNIISEIVDTIYLPKSYVEGNGVEMVTAKSGDLVRNYLFISNNDNIDNYYVSLIDRDTKELKKEIYCGFLVKDIKWNKKENTVYLACNDGRIELMSIFYDIEDTDIDTDTSIYKTESGIIDSLVYNSINGIIYPIKTNTYEISYILSGKFEPDNVNITLKKLVLDATCVVRNVMPNNTVGIWDLFDDELVYQLNSVNTLLSVKNLNYFDGDLLTLKENFDKHLLRESYQMTINEDAFIYVEGDVNDLTKYFNLESYVKFSTYGTNSYLTTDIIPIKYNKDVIYGANYSISSFLKNLDSVFTDEYSFGLYSTSFSFQPLIVDSFGEFKEFNIEKNKIYAGESLSQINKFKEGTFIDIVNNLRRIDRVYIKQIETTYYATYPTKKRYVITTDKFLETNLDLVGDVSIRTRDTLSEISMDLEFTDDLMFPISNQGTNSVVLTNNTYYRNQVTSSAYARILMDDDNVRRHVSSVVYLDEESDWNIGVINWKDDPNFYYRPLELFEVGIDRIFKKSITVDSSNYLVKGNTLNLINIDLNKYNYRIVDGLTLKELEEKYYWVLNADIRNAVIGENSNGFVWYEGDWIGGTWENGVWYSGKAYDIEWITGDLYSRKVINNSNIFVTEEDGDQTHTIWYKAVWGNGNWNGGTWNNGVWHNGNFKGIWNGGTWMKGLWNDGKFRGGNWVSGTWLAGNFSQDNSFSVWNSGYWFGGDFENGTWKTGVFDQTDRVASRFGTKSTLLNNSVWEYGWWKNGEFHSGLTVDNITGETLPSANYKYSIWKNGTWEKGIFYGGQWFMGAWKNGVWKNGYMKSDLEIKEWRVRNGDLVSGKNIEVEFTTPHYYKYLNITTASNNNLILPNYFMLLGEPLIEFGNIHPNTELLGYNTSAGKHDIIEILDEKTVLININDSNYPYVLTEGTSGYLEDLKLPFVAGTNFFIESVHYSNQLGTGKSKWSYSEKNLYLLETYSFNEVKAYPWGDTNPTIQTINSISNPAEVFWHEKSKTTFITSGYTGNVLTTGKLYAIDEDGNITTIPTAGTLYGANYISYDKLNDQLIITARNLLPNLNTNYQFVHYVNPYNYTIVTQNLVNIIPVPVGNIIASIRVNKPYVENGIAYYSFYFNYSLTPSIMRSGFMSVNTKTHALVSLHANQNNTEVLEGWNRTENIIISKENSAGTNFLYSYNDIFLDRTLILSSSDTQVFSKYLENKKELFVIDGSDLYTYTSGVLKFVWSFDHKINSIIWSNKQRAYFISLKTFSEDSVKVLSEDKKSIIWSYDIRNSLEFAQNEDTGDIIYVLGEDVAGSRIYIIDVPCENVCTDYSVFDIVLEDSYEYDISSFQYMGIPHVASHWVNGKWEGGIWDYAYWVNGLWHGGIWIDGVFANGTLGT